MKSRFMYTIAVALALICGVNVGWSAPTNTNTVAPMSATQVQAIKDTIQHYFTVTKNITISPVQLSTTGINRQSCNLQYDQVGNVAHALYRLMAYHLKCANQLLASNDTIQRSAGFEIAFAVAECAVNRLHDNALTIQVCQAYLIPNLDAAPSEEWQCVSRVHALFLAERSMETIGDDAGVAMILQQIIQVTTTTNTADVARVQLALTLDHLGKISDAISSLDAIVDPAFKDSPTVVAIRRQLVNELKG